MKLIKELDNNFIIFLILLAFFYRGWKAVLSTMPALQNPGNRSFSAFQSRIRRYSSIRRRT